MRGRLPFAHAVRSRTPPTSAAAAAAPEVGGVWDVTERASSRWSPCSWAALDASASAGFRWMARQSSPRSRFSIAQARAHAWPGGPRQCACREESGREGARLRKPQAQHPGLFRPEPSRLNCCTFSPLRYRQIEEALPKDAAETLQVGIHFGLEFVGCLLGVGWLFGARCEMPAVIQPALSFFVPVLLSPDSGRLLNTHEAQRHAGRSSLRRRARAKSQT